MLQYVTAVQGSLAGNTALFKALPVNVRSSSVEHLNVYKHECRSMSLNSWQASAMLTYPCDRLIKYPPPPSSRGRGYLRHEPMWASTLIIATSEVWKV